jgi:hypothetical protein
MIIRTGTLSNGVATVTALKRTDDLTAGLFIYGNNVPVETKIQSIDSATQITMDKNASGSGAISLDFNPGHVGVYHERNCALEDARFQIDERGELIQIIERNEVNVSRDRYNSVKKRSQTTKYSFKTYPIDFNPNERALEKAGLREEVDVVIYTAMKDWSDNGIDFKDIEPTKMTIKLRGENYEIKQKGLASQFSDTFLWITFGIFKR